MILCLAFGLYTNYSEVMPRNQVPPTDEFQFATSAREAMKADERSWPWLSRATGIHVNTLRSQLRDEPSRLKVRTARRVATALSIPFWGANKSVEPTERAA